MKKLSILAISVALFASITACGAFGGLPSLKSSFVLSEDTIPGTNETVKTLLPYGSVINYYGYVKPGQAPDGLADGNKKAYYLYVWIPAVIAEMGVRMISPTGEIGEPGDGDLVSDAFKAATPEEKSMPHWFDTWIRVERMSAIMPDQIAKAAKAKPVQKLDDDDDGDDTYKEERHNKYNSLTRIKIPNPPKSFDDLKNIDTKKLLVRGLYRISFTTYKPGEVKGSFVASVGLLFPPGIPGVSPLIHSNPEELQKQAIAAEESLKKAASDATK
uniref:Outer membrane protein n=1 Tax=Leptospira interrogans serovar Canicola TaxID=211880 RepID=G9JJR9_LEPIR|nr:outer membrane protein [Leptospira interrogans serovar Canicola]